LIHWITNQKRVLLSLTRGFQKLEMLWWDHVVIFSYCSVVP